MPKALKLPQIGFGTYRMHGVEAEKVMASAYDVGYRYFDTAIFYENEQEIGNVLCKKPREEFILSTKLHVDQMGYHPALNGVERSLNKLQTDYIDLYLLHWPNPRDLVLETLEALDSLKQKGRIREYGVCNSTIHHLEDMREGGFKVFCNQVEYHLYFDQEELLDYCLNHEIQLVGYCPLARGALREEGALLEIAKKYEKTPAQIALRWLIQKKIVPIPKTVNYNRLQENFDLFDFNLLDEEVARLNKLNRNYRIVAPDCQDFDY